MPSDDPSNPLNETHLRKLNSGLAKLDDAERSIERAIRAGIDVGDQRQQTRDAREKILRIKQEYFPGEP